MQWQKLTGNPTSKELTTTVPMTTTFQMSAASAMPRQQHHRKSPGQTTSVKKEKHQNLQQAQWQQLPTIQR